METRERVLAALMESPAGKSGEALAKELGVSRNAIWKAVVALKQEGYSISARQNVGYRLENEPVSAIGIRRAMRHVVPIEVADEMDSTNNRAKALAESGVPAGTLVCARRQTGGRGRYGRPFFSPEGGVYMSVILRPNVPAERAVMLTPMAAVAAARAIEALAEVRVEIKWVNDLFIRGKKVSGILSEASMDFESGQLAYAVIGMGINVSPMTFPGELVNVATSIGNEWPGKVSPNRLIAGVCDNLLDLSGDLETASFMDEYRARSNVIGKRIQVRRGDEQFPARAIAIDDAGGLVIETEDGTQIVRSGEISVRLEN
ncbi:MAG: biotin--[acetyl-CoA-carboxylase] ligase [Candidatus Faecivicinus sp.]|nr:biotin--[acetyl-CoA-carboxylase] ligase [Candidatus Faecivicinus sp.]